MSDFINYSPFETFWHKSFFKLNDLYYKMFNPVAKFDRPEYSAQESSDLIYEALSSDKPCMIARYGSTELYCLSNYIGIQQGWKNAIKFIRSKAEPWWWVPARVYEMRDFSGFFPLNEESVTNFCTLMLEDMKQLDILASWQAKEKNLDFGLASKTKIFLPYLEPWHADIPWSRILEGKKVLVVHHFAEQIEAQYKNHREELFANKRILPQFALRTVKSVMSYGGDTSEGFKSWFDALHWMQSEIDKEDYDICLLGCGAYGFPLAAHVKRSGKKAVHMGGALQLLFGIKGHRWEDSMYGVEKWGLPYNFYPNMFNGFWIKPGDSTKPKDAHKIEGGCYW